MFVVVTDGLYPSAAITKKLNAYPSREEKDGPPLHPFVLPHRRVYTRKEKKEGRRMVVHPSLLIGNTRSIDPP